MAETSSEIPLPRGLSNLQANGSGSLMGSNARLDPKSVQHLAEATLDSLPPAKAIAMPKTPSNVSIGMISHPSRPSSVVSRNHFSPAGQMGASQSSGIGMASSASLAYAAGSVRGSSHSVNRPDVLRNLKRRSIGGTHASVMSGLPSAIHPQLSTTSGMSKPSSAGSKAPVVASKTLMQMSPGAALAKDLEAGDEDPTHPSIQKTRSMQEMVDDSLLKHQVDDTEANKKKETRCERFWRRVLSIRTVTVAMFSGMLLFNGLFIFLFLHFTNAASMKTMTTTIRAALSNDLDDRLHSTLNSGENFASDMSDMYRLGYFKADTLSDYEKILPYMMARLNLTKDSVDSAWITPKNDIGGGIWGVYHLPNGKFTKWINSAIQPATATQPRTYQFSMDDNWNWNTVPDYDIPGYNNPELYEYVKYLDPVVESNRSKVRWTNPYIYADGRPYISVAKMAFDYHDTFLGTVGCDMDLRRMSELLTTMTADSANSIMYIVNTVSNQLVGSSDNAPNVLCNGETPVDINQADSACTNKSIASIDFQGLPSYMHEINNVVAQTHGTWGNIDADYSTEMSLNGRKYMISFNPFTKAEVNIDWVVVVMLDRATYLASVDRSSNIAIGVVVALITVSAVATFVFALRITKPLLEVAERMNLLFTSKSLSAATLENDAGEERGENDGAGGKRAEEQVLKVPTSRLAEIHVLETSFDNMKSSIRGFQKFVHPLVVQRIICNEPGAAEVSVTRKEVSIFFSDIKNFTVLSESLPIAVLITILSKYLDFMTKVIATFDGIVADFIGDAIMAFWEDNPDHAINATQCALDQQKAMHAFNKMLAEKGYEPMTVRMGLHVGMVLVGNIGSEYRLKYGCVGDDVNLCSRLEGLNKRYDSRIICSQECVDKWVPGTYEARALENVIVKGRSTETWLYELCGEVGEVDAEVLERNREYGRLREAVAALAVGVGQVSEVKSAHPLRPDVNEEKAEMLLEEIEGYLQKYPDDLAAVLLRDRLTSGNYAGAVKLMEK